MKNRLVDLAVVTALAISRPTKIALKKWWLTFPIVALIVGISFPTEGTISKSGLNHITLTLAIADNVEIQAALDALPSTGGEVHLLEGTYTLTNVPGQIYSLVMRDNQTLSGNGVNTVLKLENAHTGDFDAIVNSDQANGNQGIIIKDLTLDGNSTNQTLGDHDGIDFMRLGWASGKQGVVVTNVNFINWRGAGFEGNRINQSLFSSNTFINSNIGITFGQGEAALGTSIVGNTFINNITSDIVLGNLTTRYAVVGNTHYGTTATSWRLNNATYNAVEGNTSYKTVGYGLFADGGSNYNTIIGNTSRSGAIGFAFSDAHYNNVMGNTATYATYYGFGFDTGSSHNLVNGNTAEYNGNEGFYFGGRAAPATDMVSYNIIVNNRARLNRHQGISLWRRANYNVVEGNWLEANYQAQDNTNANLSINHDSSYNLVTNNFIWRGTQAIQPRYGIWIMTAGSVGNIIKDNYLIDSGKTAPLLDGGIGTVIGQNVGYVTENSGAASITGAVNSVDITHGLAATPTRVLVQSQQSGQGDYWVSAKGITTFTISFVTQPGASTWYFDWKAVVGDG